MARKSQKGIAPPRYDEAFKAGAIRLVTEERRPAKKVAQELGICIDILRSWLRGAGAGSVREYNQTSRTKELEAEVRALRKALAQREEGVEILKNQSASFRNDSGQVLLCECESSLSRCGEAMPGPRNLPQQLLRMENRKLGKREASNQRLSRLILWLHQRYPALGLDSIYHILRRKYQCSRGRVHRLMKLWGVRSVRKKAFRNTTNSNHKHPIAPNLPGRNFHADKPNKAWVGDITYIPTGERWLYLAAIKDLCTKIVVGYAFSRRMDTALTLEALRMAYRRQKPGKGLIFHSDRGVQ